MAEIKWKSQEEIEEEENAPRELTEVEKLQKENEMNAIAILELTEMIMKGGK